MFRAHSLSADATETVLKIIFEGGRMIEVEVDILGPLCCAKAIAFEDSMVFF
jgi:hypothetical protein